MDHLNNQYDPFLDLSTSSSPASQIEEEVEATPYKKRKELNRKSEKNRRNRFNEKLQLLQELLFATEENRSKKKKIRKEDIVEEAISYIQELRKK